MSRIADVTELLCLAAQASARAARPRPGDIATPADHRAFARECRERVRVIDASDASTKAVA
jgi:hypothetical protein